MVEIIFSLHWSSNNPISKIRFSSFIFFSPFSFPSKIERNKPQKSINKSKDTTSCLRQKMLTSYIFRGMETPLLKVNSFGGGGWIQWFTYPGKEKNASITTFLGVANTHFHLERCRRYTQCRRKFKNALEIRLIKNVLPPSRKNLQ